MSILPGGYDDCHHNKGGTTTPTVPSLPANGSRECAPDDRLREAIQCPKERLDCFVAFAPRNDDERCNEPYTRLFAPIRSAWLEQLMLVARAGRGFAGGETPARY
jgi:hypothetical protein